MRRMKEPDVLIAEIERLLQELKKALAAQPEHTAREREHWQPGVPKVEVRVDEPPSAFGRQSCATKPLRSYPPPFRDKNLGTL